MEIYERIKTRRKELGLSADSVAEALGVSRATIYRYESADIEKLPTTIIEPLAKILHCSIAYLMGWDEDKKDSPNKENAPEILEYYHQLNDIGKHEATKRVEELSHLPKYIKNDEIVLNAAHADDYANAPDELKQQEEDIMDSEDF